MKVPLAHPRNILFGHMLSALSGVFVFSMLGFSSLSVGGVGLAIFLMMTTKTVHPPAGANPIIADSWCKRDKFRFNASSSRSIFYSSICNYL